LTATATATLRISLHSAKSLVVSSCFVAVAVAVKDHDNVNDHVNDHAKSSRKVAFPDEN
jgi:hypothetical protein